MKRKAPAREGIEARRTRLLAALKTALAAAPRSVDFDGHEYRVVDPEDFAERFGFDRLQLLNDVVDLIGLGEIAFGPTPADEPEQPEREWLVRLL